MGSALWRQAPNNRASRGEAELVGPVALVVDVVCNNVAEGRNMTEGVPPGRTEASLGPNGTPKSMAVVYLNVV